VSITFTDARESHFASLAHGVDVGTPTVSITQTDTKESHFAVSITLTDIRKSYFVSVVLELTGGPNCVH
jgi:hypothetical protein